MYSQVFVPIDRMLALVCKDPKQLVTALRIIEREEMFDLSRFFFYERLNFCLNLRLDDDWRKKKQEIHFMPSDRPKRWKEKCFSDIRKNIEHR